MRDCLLVSLRRFDQFESALVAYAQYILCTCLQDCAGNREYIAYGTRNPIEASLVTVLLSFVKTYLSSNF